jgi:hypothetical protein
VFNELAKFSVIFLIITAKSLREDFLLTAIYDGNQQLKKKFLPFGHRIKQILLLPVEYDISPISIIEFSNFKALAETPTLIFEISFNI